MKTTKQKANLNKNSKLHKNELLETKSHYQKKEFTSLEIESDWIKVRFNKKTEENSINSNQIKNPTRKKSINKIIFNWLKWIPYFYFTLQITQEHLNKLYVAKFNSALIVNITELRKIKFEIESESEVSGDGIESGYDINTRVFPSLSNDFIGSGKIIDVVSKK